MKAIFLFTILNFALIKLLSQSLCNEEVFPLMYNSPPSYVCCENCNTDKDTLFYVTIKAIKDTLMPTNEPLMLRFYSQDGQVKNTSFRVCNLHNNAFYLQKYRKFILTQNMTRNHFTSRQSFAFFLSNNGYKIDYVNKFVAFNAIDTMFIYLDNNIDSIRSNYNIIPNAHLLHTRLGNVEENDYWKIWFCGYFYKVNNISITYNQYIADSVYLLRLSEIRGEYGFTHIYLSYKYGILGIVSELHDKYLIKQTVETWFPPFHSPTFRKEENPPVKEE